MLFTISLKGCSPRRKWESVRDGTHQKNLYSLHTDSVKYQPLEKATNLHGFVQTIILIPILLLRPYLALLNKPSTKILDPDDLQHLTSSSSSRYISTFSSFYLKQLANRRQRKTMG